MCSDEDDGGSFVGRDAGQQLETIAVGHLVVEENDIGLQIRGPIAAAGVHRPFATPLRPNKPLSLRSPVAQASLYATTSSCTPTGEPVVRTRALLLVCLRLSQAVAAQQKDTYTRSRQSARRCAVLQAAHLDVLAVDQQDGKVLRSNRFTLDLRKETQNGKSPPTWMART
jgi:hypothetical protein